MVRSDKIKESPSVQGIKYTQRLQIHPPLERELTLREQRTYTNLRKKMEEAYDKFERSFPDARVWLEDITTSEEESDDLLSSTEEEDEKEIVVKKEEKEISIPRVNKIIIDLTK